MDVLHASLLVAAAASNACRDACTGVNQAHCVPAEQCFKRIMSCMRAQVREAAAAGPDGEVAAGAPAGFAYDPSSGHFYSAEAGLYYDASSGGYFSSSTSRWYSLDPATNQYVEWPTGSS